MVLNWANVYFANLVLGYSTNCDEAMFGIQKASLNMFWEYSPSLTNLSSDWLRSEIECSPVDEQEKEEENG